MDEKSLHPQLAASILGLLIMFNETSTQTQEDAMEQIKRTPPSSRVYYIGLVLGPYCLPTTSTPVDQMAF